MKRKIYSTILVIGLIGSLLAGCGNKKAEEANNGKEIINPGDPIIVSTMNDTEGEILGRMMALALEDAGYEVTDNTFGYQGTVNGRTALLEGETDIYMDYTGRGLRLIEGVDPALYSKMDTAFESISTWDKENNNLIWMTYAPYSNTDGLAVTKEFSKKNNVKTLVDLADYINNGGEVKLLCHNYFVTLATGLPGLEAAYGFKIPEDDIIVDISNPEQMLSEETNGANVCHIYTSSGLIDAHDLVVLEDSKGICPVYSPAPIIRKERLEKYPGIQDVMEKIFTSITLEDQVKMNEKVQVEGESGVDVAREYLQSKNLISK